MFQWDAVDTSPDLAGRNVLETSEMVIPHDGQTTRTELERVFHRWIYFDLLSKNIFLALWWGAIAPIPPMDRPVYGTVC